VEKLELDGYLAMYRVGNYLSTQGLYRIVYDKTEELIEWLINNDIVEKEYLLKCLNCREDNLGKLTVIERLAFEDNYNEYKKTKEYEYYEAMEKEIQGYCMECDHNLDEMIDYNYDLHFEPLYRIVKRRDTSLDLY